MKCSSSLLTFAALLAAAFILVTGRSLPTIVASHFAVGGDADGFMPRNAYLGLMLAVTVMLPLLMAVGLGLVRFIPARFVNLPNREYWLAPERATETFAFLQSHGRSFAALLMAFLCFVHWLVVQANALQPPHIGVSWLLAGLLLFVLAVAVWIGAFFVHFRRRP